MTQLSLTEATQFMNELFAIGSRQITRRGEPRSKPATTRTFTSTTQTANLSDTRRWRASAILSSRGSRRPL